MNKKFLVLGTILLLAGCAATKQAITDYQTGANTALVNGETSPSQKAAVIETTTAALPIPFSGPIAVGLGFLATVFFTWQRGVSIRKNGGAPVVTPASSSILTNGVLQDVANIFSGMFTTASTTSPSATGSVVQRIWKVAVATLASGTALALTNSDVSSFLSVHPYLDAAFVAISSGLAGIEKAMSTVPVVATPTPVAI